MFGTAESHKGLVGRAGGWVTTAILFSVKKRTDEAEWDDMSSGNVPVLSAPPVWGSSPDTCTPTSSYALGSLCTGLFKMIVGDLTTCHTQYTWDRSICIFLFNRTTLQVFVTYFTGALYVHPSWFYKHQHENRVHSKLFVACQQWWFQWRFWFLCSKWRNA